MVLVDHEILWGASAAFSLVGAKPKEGCRFAATVIAQAFLSDCCKVLAEDLPFARAPFATLLSSRATNLFRPPLWASL